VLDAAGSFGRNVVGSTVGSDVGGRVGGAIAGEKGQILGSLAGGAAPSVSPSSIIQSRYAGRGKQNAPEIAAAAERLGIEPTAGALGNLDIQARENRYAGNYPQGLASREQQRIRAEMAGAGEDIGVQRGGTGGSVAQVGDDIRSATTDRLQADRDYSSAGQENLQRDVGDLTPVPIYNIIQQARAAYPGLTVPGRNALTHRIVEQLYPLITQRDAHGNPVIGPNSTVPYGLLKQWRTELGQSFDQGRIPRNRELYGPATDAMADAASSTGIPRGEFNRVQEFTRGVEGEGGLADRLAPYDKEPQAAYNYTLEGGLNNPDRVQTFARETAGDPRQDRVFGNYLQQLAADTLGTGGAQGPRKFADIIQNADPRAIATIADQVAPAVRDLATVAQGVNVPTSQTGLTRATGGVANTLGGKFLGSEVLGQLAGAIDPILAMPARGIGYLARPSLDWINQRIMQSDAAKRGMIGAPNPRRPMSIDELVRILNIVGQQQGQQQPAP
jgi:hypothetical protein